MGHLTPLLIPRFNPIDSMSMPLTTPAELTSNTNFPHMVSASSGGLIPSDFTLGAPATSIQLSPNSNANIAGPSSSSSSTSHIGIPSPLSPFVNPHVQNLQMQHRGTGGGSGSGSSSGTSSPSGSPGSGRRRANTIPGSQARHALNAKKDHPYESPGSPISPNGSRSGTPIPSPSPLRQASNSSFHHSNSIMGLESNPQTPTTPIAANKVAIPSMASAKTPEVQVSTEERYRQLDEELLKIDFEDVTVTTLKEMLRVRGLASTGKKALLVERIQEQIKINKLREEGKLPPEEDPRHPLYQQIQQQKMAAAAAAAAAATAAAAITSPNGSDLVNNGAQQQQQQQQYPTSPLHSQSPRLQHYNPPVSSAPMSPVLLAGFNTMNNNNNNNNMSPVPGLSASGTSTPTSATSSISSLTSTDSPLISSADSSSPRRGHHAHGHGHHAHGHNNSRNVLHATRQRSVSDSRVQRPPALSRMLLEEAAAAAAAKAYQEQGGLGQGLGFSYQNGGSSEMMSVVEVPEGVDGHQGMGRGDGSGAPLLSASVQELTMTFDGLTIPQPSPQGQQ
ncbi:hypothetical protein HDU76_005394 [Blyttiomyces sp. JEL0837]|nr:hypothetical protein HDU76_005394 [Blyttiomyces sp. JEL0837]